LTVLSLQFFNLELRTANLELINTMKKYTKIHEEYAITPLTISPNHRAWSSKLLVDLLDGYEVGNRQICVFKDGGLFYYVDMDAWEKGSKILVDKIQNNKAFVDLVIEKSEQISKELIDLVKKTERENLSNWSDDQLCDFLFKTYYLSIDFCAYGYVAVLSDLYFQQLTKLLKEIINKANSKAKFQMPVSEIVHILSAPNKFAPSKLARIELLKMLSNLNDLSSDKSQSKLKNYYDDWFWVDYGHFGPRMTFQNMLDSVDIMLNDKEKLNEELNNIFKETEKLEFDQVDLLNKLKLTDKEKHLFDTAKKFMYLKALRMEVSFGVWAQWERILQQIAKRLYVPMKLLYFCSVQELSDWLLKEKEISINLLKEREKFNLWLGIDKNDQEILSGEKAEQYLEEHAILEEEDVKEVLCIHGTLASSGHAKGRVKIVNKAEEIDKVEEGDILVSVATNPTLLPAMKKAAAFVTDAGGITSHAAIVARELKKPCLIGTKIATKILKDGDLVEVDASQEIVKKI